MPRHIPLAKARMEKQQMNAKTVPARDFLKPFNPKGRKVVVQWPEHRTYTRKRSYRDTAILLWKEVRGYNFVDTKLDKIKGISKTNLIDFLKRAQQNGLITAKYVGFKNEIRIGFRWNANPMKKMSQPKRRTKQVVLKEREFKRLKNANKRLKTRVATLEAEITKLKGPLPSGLRLIPMDTTAAAS